MKTKYTKEVVENLARRSNSIADMIRLANIKTRSGGSHKHLKTLIDFYKIDTSHFYNKGLRKIAKPLTLRQFKKAVLCKNGKWHTSNIRIRILKLKLLPEQCAICNLPPIWNGKKLTLQLDHKNGDTRDNRLSNLQILCPNCHTQTDNHSLIKTFQQS